MDYSVFCCEGFKTMHRGVCLKCMNQTAVSLLVKWQSDQMEALNEAGVGRTDHCLTVATLFAVDQSTHSGCYGYYRKDPPDQCQG